MKHLRLALLLTLAAFAPAVRAAQTFVVPLKANDAMSKVVNDTSNALATLQSSFSGTSAPTSPTPVEGQFWWDTDDNILYHYNGAAWVPASLHVPLTSTTATPYTLTAANGILLVDATAGAKTVTVATAVGLNGTIFTVVKVDSSSNAVTFDPDGTETISGASTYALSGQYEAITFTSDGANWQVVQSHIPVPVRAARGGTGQSSYTTGDVLYASSASALAKLAIGSSGAIMYSSGTAPAWSTSATYNQSATAANITISAALAGLANRVKVQVTNTDNTGVAEFRAINDSGDVFAMLINGSNVVDSGLYIDRTAAIVGVASGGFLLINEAAAGDIIFAAGGFAAADEAFRVLNTVGTRFAGPLEDLDNFVIKIDSDNGGSNYLYVTDGAGANVLELDESGNLAIDARITTGGAIWKDCSILSSAGITDAWANTGGIGLDTSTDGEFVWVPIPYQAGTTLTRLRVKYAGTDGSTGVIVTLRKRDESGTTTAFTTVGAAQTMLNSGAIVTTYDFANEAMDANRSYEIQFESEVPGGQTVTLYAWGIETDGRNF